MGSRIFLNCLNAEQIAACFLADQLCYILCVSKDFSVHRYTAGSGFSVCSVCLRHRKVGDQNISCLFCLVYRLVLLYCRFRPGFCPGFIA